MRYARPTNSAASSSHADDGMQKMTVKFLECGFDFERFCVPTSLHHHHALVTVSVIAVQQVVSSNNNYYYLKILVRHFNSHQEKLSPENIPTCCLHRLTAVERRDWDQHDSILNPHVL